MGEDTYITVNAIMQMLDMVSGTTVYKAKEVSLRRFLCTWSINYYSESDRSERSMMSRGPDREVVVIVPCLGTRAASMGRWP